MDRWESIDRVGAGSYRFRMRNTRSQVCVVFAVCAALIGGCVPAGVASPQRRAQAVVLTDQGESRRATGDMEGALDSFQEALAANPGHVPAHIGTGDVYRVRGEFQKAEESYGKARELEPTSFDANQKLGVLYQLTRRVREAIDFYLNALMIDPASFEANSNLAAAFSQLGEPGQARPYAERAAQLKPDSQPVWLNLASIYIALGRDDLAIDAYRSAADTGELSPGDTMRLAEAQLRCGHHERAVNVLEALIRREPGNGAAHERRGYALFRLLRFEESIAAYGRALEIDGGDTAALNGLGVNKMVLALRRNPPDAGLKEEALEAWRESLRVKPDQLKIVDLLARYR